MNVQNSSRSSTPVELSIVMPCLNEARTLAICVNKAQEFLRRAHIEGEVIVADNGSTDGSQEIAESLGARLVAVPIRGYGAALKAGIDAAQGRFVIMGDSDDTYDFSALDPFVEKLREGHDVVLGNRFRGGIRDGAMPPLHRYFGNPLLTLLARIFFEVPSGDVYCGLRGFTKVAYSHMQLRSNGMEFALEMIVKATLMKLRITEVPTTLSPDTRGREPHLRSWRDGRRSLRLYLFCSPRWLFLLPGVLFMLVGIVSGLLLLIGPVRLPGLTFDIHTLAYSSAAILIGFQALCFFTFAKMLAMGQGLIPPDPRFKRFITAFRIEYGITVGAVVFIAGIAAAVYAVHLWRQKEFGDLDPFIMMRLIIPSALAVTLGVQIGLSSLFLSLLKSYWRQSIMLAGELDRPLARPADPAGAPRP